jgi:hypothetical protein
MSGRRTARTLPERKPGTEIGIRRQGGNPGRPLFSLEVDDRQRETEPQFLLQINLNMV